MEATAAVAAAAAVRGASLQMPPPSRKEWRAVAEHHHSARNPDDEELDNTKLGQSDERTIYEQGREPLDVDFCSITVDGTLDNDILQQQLHNVVRQRQELLQMEIGLKAQMIARTEIMDMRNTFDAQLKDNVNNTNKLQEQLCERERTVHDLERKMEEKERELHAIKLDNEAAWAKQDLLREQNKELATFRMERDHSEAERAQHIKQIHDLQEHIQEKDRQLIELQEQHRGAQETIMFKDEQLREAQAWIARVREMDVFQSTTNQTLQAELRERTEQYNQLWMGFQRQFAEMERVHLHTIQQLQLELADARERSGAYNDDSRMSQMNSKSNATQFGHENGSQFDLNGSNASGGNNGLLPNESTDNGVPFSSTGNASIQTEHVPGVPITPSSLLVQPSYLPHGQVAALHPFVMHQQGVPNSVASHVPQSHVGHFHPVPSMSPVQQWQGQQSVPEGSQLPIQEHSSPSQTDQNLMRSDAKFSYEMSVNGQTLHRDYLDAHIQQGDGAQTVISSVTTETQDQSMQQISSQFSDALRLNSFEPNGEIKEQSSVTLSNDVPDDQVLLSEQASSATNASPVKSQSVNHEEVIQNNSTDSVLSEVFTSSGSTASTTITKTSETALLDEKSLLACIVRTIPAGGRIRISSTLPNRLGKMLAPLHWHDYKRKYGKLDDFVGSHPELFFIEDDYIQLREGAQKIVAATAAVAKVAAAAAASTPYSSYMSTVAVTPMAQSHRMKKVPSIDSKNIKSDKTLQEYAVISSNLGDDPLKLSVMQHQQSNGPNFSVSGGLSNVKILSKSKDSREMDGPESRVVPSSVQLSVGNGGSAQISGSANGRLVSSFTSKQQTRATGAVYHSRR
ncbi:stress response protein NST1 isoform X4 [Phaseolus vulgaris]|uniref:stress response protein NST1 isoform X4 n=1 Tax=Phaseolus vulgaris TaxID=3885 RepID=UPI0035C955D9